MDKNKCLVICAICIFTVTQQYNANADNVQPEPDLSKSTSASTLEQTVLIEAESFNKNGGWVIDQQVMDQMGSPFLLAHGLGRPVEDATTTVKFPHNGEYHIWVRTRDWVAQWKKPDLSPAMKAVGTPGKFQLLVDGQAIATTFGTEGIQWHWQDGGTINIRKKSVKLALHDLTGFDGRCDAILFSTNHQLIPPNNLPEMRVFRRKLLGYPDSPPEAGQYEFRLYANDMFLGRIAVNAVLREA